jgi:two-component system, chemotaxis family, protein-glutamate methylesterase/glutaminase
MTRSSTLSNASKQDDGLHRGSVGLKNEGDRMVSIEPGNRKGPPVSLTGPPRDIVVTGASRGGVEALRGIVAALPTSLQSTLLVVVHISPTHASLLADVLSRAGPLPAEHQRNGTRMERGRIYVAPPDHHMTVGPTGFIRLDQGRKEKHTRPAADPLFRSAASIYGSRVIGIVLTGGGNDRTKGLIAVEQAGGLAIVQDPGEARDSSMQISVHLDDNPDLCLPLREIPGVIIRLSSVSQASA